MGVPLLPEQCVMGGHVRPLESQANVCKSRNLTILGTASTGYFNPLLQHWATKKKKAYLFQYMQPELQ